MTDQQKIIEAVCKGNEKAVLRLLKKGFNPGVLIDTSVLPAENNHSGERETLLHLAAKNGFLKICRLLLEYGIDINVRTSGNCSSGNTPLHYAAYSGYGETVRFLVSEGADISAVNSAGFSVLDYASFSGLLWLIREIVAIGADINEKKTGPGPLNFAARGGHSDVIRYFLRRGAIIRNINSLFADACEGGVLWFVQDLFEKGAEVKSLDESGETPLHRAARGINTVAVVQFLVENNADPDAAISGGDDDGATPLHRAVQSGNLPVVQFLVRRGADPDRNSSRLGPPLLFAAACNQYKIVTFLIKSGVDISVEIGNRIHSSSPDFSYNDKTLLFWAIVEKYHQIAAQLVKSGSDVRKTDSSGRTPLHYAAYFGRDSVVPALLAAGAELDAKDTVNEQTPLMCAVKGKKEETAFLLIGAGADIFLKDLEMNTLLHFASASGLEKVAAYILDHVHKNDPDAGENGCSCNIIDSRTKSGETPLHQALSHGQEKTAALLVQRGASINIQDASGNFPIHIAAGLDGNLVQIILDRGDDVDRKNGKGQTPLHCAAYHGKHDAAFVLLSESASINVRDDVGRTPLYIAAGCGHFDMVQLLVSHGADIGMGAGGYETLSPLEIARKNRHNRVVHLLAGYTGKSETELEKELRENRIRLYFEAVEKGEVWKIRLYISHYGIDANIKDIAGKTALHRAVEMKHVDMIRQMLRSGARTGEKDAAGKIPVEYCTDQDGDIIGLLNNPPRLKPDTDMIVRLLRHRPSDKRNHDLVSLFSGNRQLALSLTQSEFGKLKRLHFSGLKALIPEIRKIREKELLQDVECVNCGRNTVIRLFSKIINGNSEVPGNNSVKNLYCECASCGHEFQVPG